MNASVLELDGVKTWFPVYRGGWFERCAGHVRAVDGVTLGVRRGEVLGIVGESGCGKSTLARTIVRLVAPTAGTIRFEGRDLGTLPPRELRRVRPRLQMIFQDPYGSLNPRMTVYDTLAEPLRVHGRVARRDLGGHVAALMERVGLPGRHMRKYPHEFSGGQRQRVAIARALALNPALILADEPVSALDVSVQAQILNLIGGLCQGRDLTLVLISHDLAVVRHLSDRIAVMYLGKVVELGDAETVCARPAHPYTQALLNASPLPDPERERARLRASLPGEPGSPLNPPSGCRFHPRCPLADSTCARQEPPLEPAGGRHACACHRKEA